MFGKNSVFRPPLKMLKKTQIRPENSGYTGSSSIMIPDRRMRLNRFKRHQLILACIACAPALAQAQDVPWFGDRRYRVLVSVDPATLPNGRTSDQTPAQLTVNLASLVQTEFGQTITPDLRSMQVVRYNPTSGQVFNDGKWDYGSNSAERPFRWYDDAIPRDYPEMRTYISSTNGALTWTNMPYWGNFYDAVGNWKSGQLTWTHDQQNNEKSYYAIYFNPLAAGETPVHAEPRGFVGDGRNLTAPVSSQSTGLIHTRSDMDDWNGDGKQDMIVGNARGGITWYPNIGTAAAPQFASSKIVFTTDGKPMDIGIGSAPKVVDWDGDGVKDLILGTHHNRIAWYKNVGTNSNRQFQYKGVVNDSSNSPLELPFSAAENPPFTQEYYPVMDTADLDHDGKTDLISGGYITGQLFYYRNTGTRADGTPILSLSGTLNDESGNPLDTSWCAAPTLADFNGDGKLDIVAGNLKRSPDVATTSNFLEYFQNVGTNANPVFRKSAAMPATGTFPRASLGTPRAVDFNNDGKLDLAVSAGTQVYLYTNNGTTSSPNFQAHSTALTSEWGNDYLDVTQFVDWNRDGKLDKVYNLSVGTRIADGNPGTYANDILVTGAGTIADHSAGASGDSWHYRRLFDFNRDNVIDVMDADHDGKVWVHRATGTQGSQTFNFDGFYLRKTDGTAIDVGPVEGVDSEFEVLQGSRATYTVADFNRDGKSDIVVGNFKGNVQYFENANGGTLEDSRFSLGSLIGELPIRCSVYATDWNSDSLMDVVAAANPDKILVMLNAGNNASGQALFQPGVWLNVPSAPDGAGTPVIIADFNNDGDDDLIVQTAYGYTNWIERSYLNSGFANATILQTQQYRFGFQDRFRDTTISPFWATASSSSDVTWEYTTGPAGLQVTDVHRNATGNYWAEKRLERATTMQGDFEALANINWASSATNPGADMERLQIRLRDAGGNLLAEFGYSDSTSGYGRILASHGGQTYDSYTTQGYLSPSGSATLRVSRENGVWKLYWGNTVVLTGSAVNNVDLSKSELVFAWRHLDTLVTTFGTVGVSKFALFKMADISGEGTYGVPDWNAFHAALAAGNEDAFLLDFPYAIFDAADMNRDGVVNLLDKPLFESFMGSRGLHGGDINLDGAVNSVDFNLFAANYGSIGGMNWENGDFNYDRAVDTLDFNYLAGNFGVTGAPMLGSVIPEPTMLLPATGLFVLATQRRRTES
jgi:hypothetical protein